MKKAKNYRLSENTLAQIEHLDNDNATAAIEFAIDLAYWLSVSDEGLIARYGSLRHEKLPGLTPFQDPVPTWVIESPIVRSGKNMVQFGPIAHLGSDCNREEAISYFGVLLRRQLINNVRSSSCCHRHG